MKRLLTTRNLIILLLIVVLFIVSGFLNLNVALPVISIAPEVVFHIGSFPITNSLFTAWIVMIIAIVLAALATRRVPRNPETASNQELVPQGLFQNLVEWMIEGLYGLTREVAGNKWAGKFFPITMTIFIFVLLANWTGLIPGFGSIGWMHHPEHGEAGYMAIGPLVMKQAPVEGEGYVVTPFLRSPSADLNFTLALALMAVFLSQYWGIASNRLGYFSRFFDISGFKQGVAMGMIQFFAGILELISEIARILSFSFRLFGNIFAGEVLLAVMAFLIPYVISLPFYGLEVFIGFIQAIVFMMLALVFWSSATAGHGSEEHHT